MSQVVETRLIILTAHEASEFIRESIREALIEQAPMEPLPALLDRNEIARQLSVATSTLDRLRREGLPCVMIGNSPRFELSACLEWIRAR